MLFDSLDIDFLNYADDFTGGPIVIWDKSLSVNENDISLTCSVNGESFVFENVNVFSNRIISSFESNVIFSFYRYIKQNPTEDFVYFEVIFSYKNKSYIKEKSISRNNVLNLYNSYFKKNKEKFLSKYFNGKTSVDDTTISFTKPNLEYFPVQEINNSIISIKRQNGAHVQIYTNQNLGSEYIIRSSASNVYNTDVIYNTLEEDQTNTFYYNKRNQQIIIKYNDFQIYPINSSEIESPQQIPSFPRSILPRNSKELLFIKNNNLSTIETISKSDLPPFQLPLESSRLLSLECLSNPIIEDGVLNVDINTDILRNKSNLFNSLGFENNNNDYFNSEVFGETIVCYTISYSKNNETYEKIIHDSLSSKISKDKISIPLSGLDSSRNNNEIYFNIETLTLPKGTLQKITGIEESSDVNKESFAKFMCEAYPGSYHKVIHLIDNFLYEKSENISKEEIFKKIFDITKRKTKNFFNVRTNNDSVNNSVSEDISNDLFSASLKTVYNKVFLEKNLKEISSQNAKYKNSFYFHSVYKEENKSIKIFKRKKDKIIASFDLTELNKVLPSLDNVSISVSMLMTFEFDDKLINSQENKNVKNKKYLIEEKTYFMFKNMTFEIRNNKMFIFAPVKESTLSLTEDSYKKFYNFWGKKDKLYIKGLLERYTIIFSKEGFVKETINVNNLIRKDYTNNNSSLQKTYVLNGKLHMPNILLKFN